MPFRTIAFQSSAFQPSAFQSIPTPAASATASAAARAALAIWSLFGARLTSHFIWRFAGRFVGFLFVGFAVLAGTAFHGFGHDAHGFTVLARSSALTRFAAAAPAAAPLAAVTVPFAFAGGFLACGSVVGQAFGLFGFDFRFDVERLFVVIGLVDLRRGGGGLRCEQGFRRFQRVHLFAAVDDERLLAAHGRIGDHRERNLEGVFEVAQMAALVVEDVERDVGPGAHHQIVGRALHQDFLDAAQQLQRHRRDRTHVTAAAALRAGLGRTLQHAGADALTRHFQQAEMRDASDLDARAVLPQAVGEFPLDGAVVALLVHVDEVDDDEAGEIAQAELAGDFLGRLQIGLERGILDVMLAGRSPGVDVDRDQRLGLVDDDVAAGAQLHGRREHRIELALDPHPGEQRLAVAILPDRPHVGGHQHFHEVARFLIAGFAGDLDLVDFLVVEVAQRALDQRAFLVDEGRRLRLQRHVAHGFPHADQIFEVALDLGLGARGACGAQNDAHAFGHVEILHDFLQARAVLWRS